MKQWSGGWATTLVGCVGLWAAAACVAEAPAPRLHAQASPSAPTQPTTTCVSTEDFFRDDVWAAFMGSTCFACHNAQGQAHDSELVLKSGNEPNFLTTNLATVQHVAALELGGTSLLLLKPSGQVQHGGGAVIDADSPAYAALTTLVDRFAHPVSCESDGDADVVGDFVLLDGLHTFRKAAIVAGGRVPTSDERAALADVTADDVDEGAVLGDSLDAALDGLLNEAGFARFIKDSYNDLLLTDKYVNNNGGVELLDPALFPTANWFNPGGGETGAEAANHRAASLGIAREPLELIAHVVMNDLPFTEVLQADYFMVSPYSARSYGVFDQVTFADPTSNSEFVPLFIPDTHRYGILTSPVWLNRYPSTATNRNRARARMVYKFFLATDILKLAERPVDTSDIDQLNPTRDNPNCTVCHAILDPVAGTLQAWDATGKHHPNNWFPDMFAPGFGAEPMSQSLASDGAAWLSDRVVQDPRFALAAVYTMFRALTGQEPLSAPTDVNDAAYADDVRAFALQDAALQRIADAFVESDFNLKTVVKHIVRSPYFRATGLRDGVDADAANDAVHRSFGTERLLTPDMLDRKIASVMGYPWFIGASDQRSFLTANDQYNLFYGGIDSDNVTTRITEMNGLMAAVQQRMAVEVACKLTARDFTKPVVDRLLFPFVERSYVPVDANGFDVPQALDAVRDNIAYLHERFWGEAPGDVELNATTSLFIDVLRDGNARVQAGAESADLRIPCQATQDWFTNAALPEATRVKSDANYAVRAWAAVITYLLSDYRFVHD